uniref:Branched-chain amino acid ABC transporter substrate-binding protein n=1 Tax=Thermogemmatispora argillosa TaxID=2045280 RepID=A0A455SZS6_9CHLR|nr:branched-chain amino acid ABC transporter substrate-binding protein [Thermogemmatispora argillosa]
MALFQRPHAPRRPLPIGHLFIACLLLIALALSACASSNAGGASSSGPIRIGFSITETGPQSAPAKFDLQGYQLGAEAINAQGGLLGRKVQLVYYDDQGSASTAVQLYQRLITTDKVDLLVGPYQTDLTSAIAPLVTRYKMAMPAMAANLEPFSGRYPYLVQSITQTPRYMIPVIDLAATKGYKTLALLIQDTAFPRELAQGIKQEAAARGIRVVFEATYPADTNDFTALVLKAGAAKPDMIIGATYLADAEGIIRAARASNVNAKLFAFSIGPVEPEFGSALGSAANGILGTTLWFPTLKTAGNAEFVKNFRARFGRDPDYHAAMAYATMQALAAAVKMAGSLDQTKIRDAYLKLDLQTVAGEFKLNSLGQQLGYQSYVLQWQNGKQELVWPPEVATSPVQLPHPNW